MQLVTSFEGLEEQTTSASRKSVSIGDESLSAIEMTTPINSGKNSRTNFAFLARALSSGRSFRKLQPLPAAYSIII